MTYDSDYFAHACNPRSQFNHRFLDGDATLINGDTMPVDFVTSHELRTFQVVRVYCPTEHLWLEASKVSQGLKQCIR